MINDCANALKYKIADYKMKHYDSNGDRYEDDSFYDTTADIFHTTDLEFIHKAVALLKPDANVNEVCDDALDYLAEEGENIGDNDYIKRYEVLLKGIRVVLDRIY